MKRTLLMPGSKLPIGTGCLFNMPQSGTPENIFRLLMSTSSTPTAAWLHSGLNFRKAVSRLLYFQGSSVKTLVVCCLLISVTSPTTLAFWNVYSLVRQNAAPTPETLKLKVLTPSTRSDFLNLIGSTFW